MIRDVVIDTNVLMHAQDSTCDKFNDANVFLTALGASATVICVDAGFTWEEASNRSLIGQEYLAHLQHGSTAYSLVEEMARSGRVVEVDRKVGDYQRKQINQLIRSEKARDKTFLRVAVNSHEQILVSHDYEDFQPAKRATIRARLGVSIIEARDATLRLEA